jgi:hypothetical protein
MEFVLIGFILLFILYYNNKVDTNKFIREIEPHLQFMMEDDYRFLVHAKYGGTDEAVDELYAIRIRNGLVATVVMVLIFLTQLNFIYFTLSFIIGYVVFKMPYFKIKEILSY